MLKNIETSPLNIKLHKRYALTCIQWDSIRSRNTKIESSSNVFVWNEPVRFFQRYEKTGLRETRNSPSRRAHEDEQRAIKGRSLIGVNEISGHRDGHGYRLNKIEKNRG